MREVRITADMMATARRAQSMPGIDVVIPVMTERLWEPPAVTEQRIMWNATQREPYWPEPNMINVRFDARLLAVTQEAQP